MFGKDKDDERQDKWIKQLWANQQQHSKDIGNCWAWIQKLHRDNQAQDAFDKQVIARLQAQDAKIGNTLELAKQIQDLQKAVQILQQKAHSHEVAKE